MMLKYILPSIVVDAIRRVRSGSGNRELQRYMRGGRVPWSAGYENYKRQFIVQAICDEDVLERFRRGESLPDSYGIGVDERCIEYPWLLAHLHDKPQVLLDAGATLNHDFVLAHPLLQHKVVHILTLAPEMNCFVPKGISYLFSDLRDIPIRDAYYDVIACLSTLEHVGCDNTLYTHDDSHDESHLEDFVTVLKELYRVLKPKGTLFLTLPFGTYRNFGTFQQFDRNLLSRVIKGFGQASEVIEVFYRYTSQGWNVASMEDCVECKYVEWINHPRCHWPNPLPIEHDLAAAARAVASVRIVK